MTIQLIKSIICYRYNRKRAFTLLECIVVVGVLTLLISIILAAISASKQHTRKVIAAIEVKNIESAWRQYYAEYHKLPSFASEFTQIPITGSVAFVLQGVNDTADNNPKKIPFFVFRKINAYSNPVNPWGTKNSNSTNLFYYVMFDTDGDNNITTPTGTNVMRQVIVWTYNADYRVTESDKIIGSWE